MVTMWILETTTIADSINPLTVEVKGAESGSGEGEVEIMASKSGAGLYDGETDVDNTIMQVHGRRR